MRTPPGYDGNWRVSNPDAKPLTVTLMEVIGPPAPPTGGVGVTGEIGEFNSIVMSLAVPFITTCAGLPMLTLSVVEE